MLNIFYNNVINNYYILIFYLQLNILNMTFISGDIELKVIQSNHQN